jgi:prolyl 4-hydroxylase
MVPMAVPGTIDATMQRALAHFPQYTPSVLHRDPWILHFESFLNDEEVDP